MKIVVLLLVCFLIISAFSVITLTAVKILGDPIESPRPNGDPIESPRPNGDPIESPKPNVQKFN